MNKLILLFISILGITTAHAQRYCDIKMILKSPANPTTVNCNDSFLLQYYFINEGPDALLPGDTLIGGDPTAAVNSSYLYIVPGFIVNAGDTLLADSVYTNRQQTNWVVSSDSSQIVTSGNIQDGTTYLYPVVFVRAWDTLSIVDNNRSNNVAYASITFDCPTSISEFGLDKSTLDVFPNPARDEATVAYHAPFPGNTTLRIIDISGKVLVNKDMGKLKTGKHSFSFNTSKLPDGTYFIKVVTGSSYSFGRIIVQR
jgi:hypothetical protein